MSYTRQTGYLVSRAIEQHSEKRDQLLAVLGMTPEELNRLCVGRMILSFEEQDKVAEILGMSPQEFLNQSDATAYQSVVHCMTPFSNPQNLDTIMDFIDAYIDAKEILDAQ